MKRFVLLLTLLTALSGSASLWAQQPPGAMDESTRLMQEYMQRRQEWMAFRAAAQAEIKATATEPEKRAMAARLAENEKPFLARFSAAAAAYRAAREAKRHERDAARPAN